MYWGNQNDGDYLDYYNGTFMGFAEADVTNPDGSVQKHKFYATNGYGIYDSTQVNCYSGFTCHNSPWWAPATCMDTSMSSIPMIPMAQRCWARRPPSIR